jgi:hypothetical protein
MTATDTAIAAAATWQTALAAVDAATGAAKDDALTDLMEVETRIEAEPVQDLPGATLRLRSRWPWPGGRAWTTIRHGSP